MPTPGSWIKPVAPETEKKEMSARRPFEPRPHLTDKPFKNDSGLSDLRRKMTDEKLLPGLVREESNEQNN